MHVYLRALNREETNAVTIYSLDRDVLPCQVGLGKTQNVNPYHFSVLVVIPMKSLTNVLPLYLSTLNQEENECHKEEMGSLATWA